jgi:hypothetical protein
MSNKLENICISLETAKRLHEAGIKIKSYFYWVKNESDKATTYIEYYLTDSPEKKHCEVYPAPTAEELENLILRNHGYTRQKKRCVLYDPLGTMDGNLAILHIVEHADLKESLSEHLIWLTENGYLKD